MAGGYDHGVRDALTSSERERLFADLFETNRRRLLRLCAAYLGSAADADDLFQDVMINVWKGLPAFRRDADASTWIYRIAVNTALMSRRRVAREAAVIDRHRGDAVEAAVAEETSEDAEARVARLHRAIASLSPQDRICISLVLEGLSYKDIAAITGLSVNHVGVRISRAKRALRTRMKDTDRGSI